MSTFKNEDSDPAGRIYNPVRCKYDHFRLKGLMTKE